MTRLDHNRADQPARRRSSAPPSPTSRKMTIWGNHSTTQYPDLFHAEVNGKNAYELVGDHAWVDGTFIPTVAKRGAAIIEARGASSAASAANAAVDHIRSWALGTPDGDWVSMAHPVATAATACRRASSRASRARARTASTRSCRASTSTTTAAARSTPPSAELAEERDAVQGARPDLDDRVTGHARAGQATATRQATRIIASTPRFSSSSLIRSLVSVADEVADRHHRQRLDAVDRGERVEHRRFHLDRRGGRGASSGRRCRRRGRRRAADVTIGPTCDVAPDSRPSRAAVSTSANVAARA